MIDMNCMMNCMFDVVHESDDKKTGSEGSVMINDINDELILAARLLLACPGPQGANYHFTSALAVSLLKVLAPQLQPLVVGAANRSTVS